jgi:hypothetical protein
MSAWLSFFGGYAQGAVEQIDEQRKKEEQFIQDRMKMAAATRLDRQKKAEQQRQELKDTYGELSSNPVFQSASTPQKIALMVNPTARKAFEEQYQALGVNTNIDSIVQANADKLKDYKSVDDYITKMTTPKPLPVNEQTQSAFANPKRSFGATVGSTRQDLEQNAARFGMKADDALGWEQGAAEPPSMAGAFTLKAGATAPTDPKSMLEQAQSRVTLAEQSGDSEKIKAATDNLNRVYAFINRITPDTKKDVDAQISQAITDMANAPKGSAEYIAARDRKLRLEEAKRLGTIQPKQPLGDHEKPLTANQSVAFASKRAAAKIKAIWGDKAINGQYMVSQPDGTVDIVLSAWKPDLQKEVQAAHQEEVENYFREVMTQYDGKVPPSIREAMRVFNLTPDKLNSAPAPKPNPSGTPEPSGATKPLVVTTQAEVNKLLSQRNEARKKQGLPAQSLSQLSAELAKNGVIIK